MDKPDCYKCKYRDEVPGSAHSRCRHPAFDSLKENPMIELMALLGGGGIPPIAVKGITVRGNPHGIRSGWFSHPFNFDPVWLQECDGFTHNRPT